MNNKNTKETLCNLPAPEEPKIFIFEITVTSKQKGYVTAKDEETARELIKSLEYDDIEESDDILEEIKSIYQVKEWGKNELQTNICNKRKKQK